MFAAPTCKNFLYLERTEAWSASTTRQSDEAASCGSGTMRRRTQACPSKKAQRRKPFTSVINLELEIDGRAGFGDSGAAAWEQIVNRLRTSTSGRSRWSLRRGTEERPCWHSGPRGTTVHLSGYRATRTTTLSGCACGSRRRSVRPARSRHPCSHRSTRAGAGPSRFGSWWPPLRRFVVPPSSPSTGSTSSAKKGCGDVVASLALHVPDGSTVAERGHGGPWPACVRKGGCSRSGARSLPSRGATTSGWCGDWASSSGRAQLGELGRAGRGLAGRRLPGCARTEGRRRRPGRARRRRPLRLRLSRLRAPLAARAPEDVRFPTRTSVLDAMCGPLCDAALEPPG